MFQKIFTKYWIVANIGLTILFTWLVLPESVKTVTFSSLFWMSVVICEFFVLLPSVYRGETLAGARYRAMRSLSSDPFLYIGIFLIMYLFAQWSNGGCVPEYDAAANVWGYSNPEINWLPFSVKKTDSFRWMNLVIALITIGICIRNAVGKRAKRYLLQWLCILSGLFAVYGVCSACIDIFPFNNLMLKPESGNLGTLFGLWFLIAIGAYAEAQSSRHRRTEILYLCGIIFNFTGVIFFAPMPSVFLYSLIGLFLLIYIGFYLSIHVPTHFFVKFYLLTFIALAIVITIPLLLFPQEAIITKIGSASDFTGYWSDLMTSKAVRMNAAMKIWDTHMWFGSGPNGFEHYLGFVVDDASWKNLVINKGSVYNDPVQILCEFGLLGSAIFVAMIVTLLMPLCSRAHLAWVKDTKDSNAGRPYLVRISPFVFVGVVATLCCLGESFFASPFRVPSVFMSYFIIMLCMPAFLPSR